MVTTVVRIPEDEYRLYKEVARERGISLAELFRRAARKDVKETKKPDKKYSFWNLGTKFVLKGGPKDASLNFDKYLWEAEEAKLRRFRRKGKKKR